MSEFIPYSPPKIGNLREIYPYLHNGVISAKNANILLDQGIEWSLVSPFVLDQEWWNDQNPCLAPPLKLDWQINLWGATINLELPELSIWIDPGPQAPMPNHPPDLILITHAHRDHTSRLGEFSRTYQDCPIVMSMLTIELLQLRATSDMSLRECLNNKTVQLPLQKGRVLSDTNIRLLEAGHLIGAVMIEIEFKGDRILVTGDFALRDVGGLPAPDWPDREYNLVIMGANTAGWDSLPNCDVESNRRPFLIQVDELLKKDNRLFISAQSFGQAQEIYAALIMAQRAGAFPSHTVYLSGLASEVSGIYSRELKGHRGPWSIPFNINGGEIPPNSMIISSTNPSDLQVLRKPKVYTHAGWSEHMALAVGLACNKIMFYHGDSLSLQIHLSEFGRDICFPNKEREIW